MNTNERNETIDTTRDLEDEGLTLQVRRVKKVRTGVKGGAGGLTDGDCRRCSRLTMVAMAIE